jgi:large subunit ribosomal protein L32
MVPARRKSKATKRARRSHHALKPINLVACPRCGAAKLPHAACEGCGYVNSKVALKVKAEEA